MRTLPTAVILALSLSCTGTPTLVPRGAPHWVSDGSRAVNDDEGKTLRAIGAATNIAAEGPLRQAAQSRAKIELAKVLDGFVQTLQPLAKEKNVTPTPEALQAFTAAVLAKASTKEEWKDDDGTLYVLLDLKLDTIVKTDPAMLLVGEQANDAFARYVDAGKAAQAKLPEGTCVKALRFADLPKVDPACGPVRAATLPGWLVFACDGGKGSARFGEIALEGTVDATKKVDVTLGPTVVYQKGCTYKQTERMQGTVGDGLRYQREQTLVSPENDDACPDACNVESRVAVQ